MKTVSDDGKYTATHIATLNMPKKYVKKLKNSGDPDFIALADMNGMQIPIMFPPQPYVDANSVEVAIFEPFEGMLSKNHIKDIRPLSDV